MTTSSKNKNSESLHFNKLSAEERNVFRTPGLSSTQTSLHPRPVPEDSHLGPYNPPLAFRRPTMPSISVRTQTFIINKTPTHKLDPIRVTNRTKKTGMIKKTNECFHGVDQDPVADENLGLQNADLSKILG